jgi:hypothetical protein
MHTLEAYSLSESSLLSMVTTLSPIFVYYPFQEVRSNPFSTVKKNSVAYEMLPTACKTYVPHGRLLLVKMLCLAAWKITNVLLCGFRPWCVVSVD